MKVLISALLLSLPALVIDADLSLPNPDFESGETGWLFSDNGMSTVTAQAAHSGELGLQVRDASSDKGSSVRSPRLVIESGKSYQIDFGAKVLSGGGIAVYIQFFDGQGKAMGDASKGTQVLRVIDPEQDGWKEYALAGTAPDGAQTLSVWIHSFSGNVVEAYFDDFVLREVPASAVNEHPSSQKAPGQPAWTGNPNDLEVFEKPDPAAFLAPMKVYQSDGAAFRQPLENWEQARVMVRDDPEWAAWFVAKKQSVDAWIAHNADRADWEAGWNHDFISPVDNAFLVWTDEVPGEEVDHFVSKTGDVVAVTPKLFRAWVGAFRKNHASMMIEAANLYHLTGDTAYAEWVAQQLDFYAENYDAWEHGVAKRKNSWLGYQSLDDAVIISRQADAARLIFDYATPERRQMWYTDLFKPEAELLELSFQTVHNIATWQRATQVKIALLYDDEDLFEQAMDGEYGLRAQFRNGVTSDYFWYEQSMGYNSFILMATESLFTSAAAMGKGDAVQVEAEISQNMMLAPLMIRFPDGTLPNPSDNTGTPRASTSWLAKSYRILPTYLGLERARGEKSWDTLVDPPAGIAEEQPVGTNELPEVDSRSYESTRFAVLKEGPWQLFFHYGQLNRSHAQGEALNWSASYGDTVISRDSGTVAYGSPASSEYYRQGLAHNVPLVAGHGQKPWKRGELIDFDVEGLRVEAEQADYRDNVSASRSMSIEDGVLVDVATVTLKDGSSEQLGLSLHLEGEPQLSDAFQAVSNDVFAQDRPVPFSYWSGMTAATFTDYAVVPVTFPGGLVLNVEFACPGPFTLYVGTAPGQPPATNTGFYLEGPYASEATFITRIGPEALIPPASSSSTPETVGSSTTEAGKQSL